MKANWQKHVEVVVLMAVAVWLVAPVFSYVSFYTNDGPAHLYNSTILRELLLGKGGHYLDFFELNLRPEPNWIGHILLVILLFMFEPLVAEKMLIFIYIASFLFAFRYLVRAFNTNNWAAVVLVAPFVYSFPLYIGFYNFLFGVVCLLFTLGFWIRIRNRLSNRNLGIIGLLLVTGFFSHITTFLVTIMCVGVAELHYLIMANSRLTIKQLLVRWSKLLLYISPTIVLTGVFLSAHGGSEIPENTIEAEKQWNDLIAMRPITIFHHLHQELITKWLFIAFSATVYLVAVLGSANWSTGKNGSTIDFKKDLGLGEPRQVLMIIALIFLLGYFVLPDWMASGGYVHVRLLLLFFLFLALWVAAARIPARFTLPLAVVSIMVTVKLFDGREQYRNEQNRVVREMIEVSEHLPERQTVLPIVENYHWFFGHVGNYLGALKRVIVLNNYEAATGYFPLSWKMAPNPAHFLGHPASAACGESVLEMENNGIPVNVIVHYKDGTKELGENCEYTIEQLESDQFTLVYTTRSGLTNVYLRNANPTSTQP